MANALELITELKLFFKGFPKVVMFLILTVAIKVP